MKTKTVAGIVFVLLVAGIVAAIVWWHWGPQTLTLSDGTKLKLLAVTYSKHQDFPGIVRSAWGPGSHSGFDSTNETLFVWIDQRRKDNQWPNYQFMVYDRAATACAGYSMMSARYVGPDDDIVGIRLDAFPRRERKFYLRVQEWNPQSSRQTLTKAFVISNPVHGPFPAWSPDPLPDTQSDGDLEVTLTRLACGVKEPFRRDNAAPNDPINQGVQAAFQIQQNGRAVTNWLPVQVETSDATGNHITGWCNSHWENGELMTLYQWGLWPNEPAWKLRVEFSRTSGFSAGELWTVSNLPVQPGRQQDFWNSSRFHRTANAFAEATVNGIHLKLFPAKQFTDQPDARGVIAGGLDVQSDVPLKGMRLTLLKATDDQGHEIRPMSLGSGGTDHRFGLRDLGHAKALNLTLALHRSRLVEFTVKPAKP